MLKQIIKKNKFMFCLAKCVKFRKDPETLEKMLSVTTDPAVVRLVRNGEKHIQICTIQPCGKNDGMFAAMRWTLDSLYFCEQYGLTPYLKLTSKFMYYDPEFSADKDPFEYYFKPINTVSEDDISNAECVIPYTNRNRLLAENLNTPDWYATSDRYIMAMAPIVHKYCKLNHETETYMSDSVARTLTGKRVLGVHIRGTDYKSGYRNHPQFVTVEQYMEKIDEVQGKLKFDQIFLATDDSEVISVMQKKYGTMLTYYDDVFRSSGTCGAHTAQALDRPMHHYMLGLEVLRDMVTLSRCDGLIAGLSQVGTYARIQKRADGKEYEFQTIIDNGINKTGKMFNV